LPSCSSSSLSSSSSSFSISFSIFTHNYLYSDQRFSVKISVNRLRYATISPEYSLLQFVWIIQISHLSMLIMKIVIDRRRVAAWNWVYWILLMTHSLFAVGCRYAILTDIPQQPPEFPREDCHHHGWNAS
jgi:hypothetical protein